MRMQIESSRRWSATGRVCDNGRFDLMGVGRWQSGGARFLDVKLNEVADTDGGVTLEPKEPQGSRRGWG